MSFLGAFAKLPKATISFIMSVCSSDRLHRTRLSLGGFLWNVIFNFLFQNLSRKFKFDCNLIRITKTIIHWCSYLAQFSLEWEMFYTKVVEKIKTHDLCSITFFFFRKSCRLWDNWKNVVQPGGHRWKNFSCALHAGYLRLQTHKPKSCNTHHFSTTTMFAQKHHNITLFVHYFYSYFTVFLTTVRLEMFVLNSTLFNFMLIVPCITDLY